MGKGELSILIIFLRCISLASISLTLETISFWSMFLNFDVSLRSPDWSHSASAELWMDFLPCTVFMTCNKHRSYYFPLLKNLYQKQGWTQTNSDEDSAVILFRCLTYPGYTLEEVEYEVQYTSKLLWSARASLNYGKSVIRKTKGFDARADMLQSHFSHCNFAKSYSHQLWQVL